MDSQIADGEEKAAANGVENYVAVFMTIVENRKAIRHGREVRAVESNVKAVYCR